MTRLTGPCCPSAVPRSVGSRTRPSVVHSGLGLIGHVKPPAGAPNILFVLIDDAGFGNPSTFSGPIRTPTYDRTAAQGLRYNRFHVTAMCSPTMAALLTGAQPPRGRHGRHPGILRRLPPLLGDAAPRRRTVPEDPEGERLRHCGHRQMGPHPGEGAGPRLAR
jgi:Sulfatase